MKDFFVVAAFILAMIGFQYGRSHADYLFEFLTMWAALTAALLYIISGKKSAFRTGLLLSNIAVWLAIGVKILVITQK